MGLFLGQEQLSLENGLRWLPIVTTRLQEVTAPSQEIAVVCMPNLSISMPKVGGYFQPFNRARQAVSSLNAKLR